MTVTMTAVLGPLTLVDDPTGIDPQYKLMSIDNWYSGPPVETDQDAIPLGDGGFEGYTFRRPKKLALNGMVQASSPGLAKATAWRLVSGVFPVGGGQDLTVTDEIGTLTQRVSLDGAPQVNPFTGRTAFFQIPLVANDPRKYGPYRSGSVGTALATPTDGLNFPLFTPGYLDFGAFTNINTVAVTNTGTAPTFPVFKVTGTFQNGFRIASDAGDSLVFSRGVTAASTVTISPYAGGRATQDGVDATIALTTALLSPIPPGGARAYAIYPIGSSDSTAGMTVTYREAWW